MGYTLTEPTAKPSVWTNGTLKFQLMDLVATSGTTSGSLTSSSIAKVSHAVLPAGFINTSAMTFADNVATVVAATVPTATAATLTLGGVTYTAVATDNTGNLITVRYTAGATHGAEVVTLIGTSITVQIEDGVSTITEVRTAFNLEAAAAALATATGTSATAVSAATLQPLTGGITGGVAGSVLFIGQ